MKGFDKMKYSLEQISRMEVLNANKEDEYFDHPYGELKEYTDKERVWFDKKTNEVTIERYDYGMGTGWNVEETYIAQ